MSDKRGYVRRTAITLTQRDGKWSARIDLPNLEGRGRVEGSFASDRDSREEAVGEALRDGRQHFLAGEPIDELLRATEDLPNRDWAAGDAVLADPDRFRIEIREEDPDV